MNELFRAGVWHDLICENEESSKFWSIKIFKNTHIRKWGALGTIGVEKVTTFDSVELARKDAENLYLSKTRGGYRVTKPQLLVTTQLVHRIDDVVALNNFIFKVYGVPFDFILDQDAQTGHSFTFTPDGTQIPYDIEYIEEWISGEPMVYMTHRLLDDCVRQRLIPAGVYTIEVP